MARKDSPKWRNALKWRNKSACKDSQFLIDRRRPAPFLVTTEPRGLFCTSDGPHRARA
jgi:hypothetical protein